MILKKPYKFLIQHFKIVHFVVMLIMIFLFAQYYNVFNFVNNAQKDYVGIITTNSSSVLFNIFIYLAALVIIVVSVFMIYLLHSKKKGVKLYISTVATYVYYFVIVAYSYSVISSMEYRVVEVGVLHNLKDLLLLLGALQIFEIAFFVVRALGIDLKRFDFKKDLEDLSIDELDNAEFEVNININTDKLSRNINKQKRLIGYFYKENKGVFIFGEVIIGAVLLYFIFLNVFVYNKTYSQGKYFSTNDLTMAINNSYITDYDYLNNKISENKSFVILDISVKSRFGVKKINMSLPELVIGFKKYYADSNYSKYFIDLGDAYNDEDLNNEFKRFILIYPINKSDSGKRMKFKYTNFESLTNMDAKNIMVNLKLRKLDEVKGTFEYNLGDEIDFSKSVLKNTKFKIESVEMAPSFTLNYNYCLNEEFCYNSIEYVKPSIVNNYDKVVLRLNGNIEVDDKISTKNISDLFSFVNLFGKFSYEKDGTMYDDNTALKQIVPVRVKSKSTFFEIISSAQNSEVYLNFKVRDYIYKYKLS